MQAVHVDPNWSVLEQRARVGLCNKATSMRTADSSLSPDIPCEGKTTAQTCFRDAGSVLLDVPNSQLNCTGWPEPSLARAEAKSKIEIAHGKP